MLNTKKILISIVSIVFLFQIIKFYTFYLEYSPWQYVDWVINYQGGFVRRGLVGELLYKIHQFSSVGLDIIILIFVTFVISSVSFLLIKSIDYIYNSYIDIFIFLSPGFFLYQIMNSEIIGRKDILLTLIIGLFVFFENKFKQKTLFIFFILSILFLSLSHSGFLFYMPYLIFLYLLIKYTRSEKIKTTEIIITFSTLFFIFCLIFFNQGTEAQVKGICLSALNFVPQNCTESGQLLWIGKDLDKHLSAQVYNLKTVTIYFVSLVLVYLFLGIRLYNCRLKVNYIGLNKINPLIILVFLFLSTFPIYFLGSDWGRYIFLSYCCSFFIFIFCVKKNLFSEKYNLKLKKYIFLTILVFYSFVWTFPFYHAENFKFTLKKPFINLIKKF